MAKKNSSGTKKTESQSASVTDSDKKDVIVTDTSEQAVEPEASSAEQQSTHNKAADKSSPTESGQNKNIQASNEQSDKSRDKQSKDTKSQKAQKEMQGKNKKDRAVTVENESPANKKSVMVFIALFLIIIVAAASAAAAYYFWTEQQKHQRKQQQYAEMVKQQALAISSLQSQLQTISGSTSTSASLATTNSEQLQQLSEQLKQTEAVSQRAIEVVNRTQRGWALAEVDYLLRMAHRRIEVARDISGAIAALKGADSRLAQLGDLSLFKIRKQLAKDIANLNAVYQADANGVSLAIDQMIINLTELPFKRAKDEVKEQINQHETAEQKAKDDGAEKQQQSFIDSVYEAVIELGDIKVHTHEIEAASSAQQKYQIEQMLRTYLLSARLAVLQFNQTQFLHEINRAKEILHRHYDETDNRVQQLIKTLDGYTQLQLTPDLPQLTIAWAMLQKKIKNQAYQVPVEEARKKVRAKSAEKKPEKAPQKPQLKEKEEVKI